jgi:hypothetical protein
VVVPVGLAGPLVIPAGDGDAAQQRPGALGCTTRGVVDTSWQIGGPWGSPICGRLLATGQHRWTACAPAS